jgi:FMN-dependent oxidoreductase (nitrilotriacetate monooxygenase family)
MAQPRGLMHLMTFTLFCPNQHSFGEWRYPLTVPNGFEWNKPAVWQQMAREVERGKFDAMFFADHLAPFNTYGGSWEPTLEHAVMAPVHDPLVLLPMLAAVTDRLGLCGTLSTSYYHPYMAVRKMATLDHLTNGRFGWNIVTSFGLNEARAFGIPLRPHDERYVAADEYMELMEKLWASWEPDAVLHDREAGRYVDTSKIHPVSHDGTYYKCSGIAFAEPSPQGRPVLFQAGQSPAGRDFCAKWAEACFAIMATAGQMREFTNDMRDRVERAGRPADAVQYMFGIQPIVGRTEAEARETQQAVYELMGADAAMAAISGQTGIDFGTFDPNASVHDVPAAPGLRGVFDALRQVAGETNQEMTVAQAVQRYAESNLMLPVVGSPRQVADQLISMWEESEGAGFLMTPLYYPGAMTAFVDLVVPLLQKAGVFRRDYTGKMLRDHLAQTELGG